VQFQLDKRKSAHCGKVHRGNLYIGEVDPYRVFPDIERRSDDDNNAGDANDIQQADGTAKANFPFPMVIFVREPLEERRGINIAIWVYCRKGVVGFHAVPRPGFGTALQWA
jgi:hypothetical protein